MNRSPRRRRGAWPRIAPEAESFGKLVAVARRLQRPDGCPWDRAQTVDSLLPHLVEETWEVFQAVRRGRRRQVQEELGDTLYTVVFLALLAERDGRLTLEELLRRTRQKMIRRHPHVFGAARAHNAQEAYAHWQAAKRRERKSRSPSKRLRPVLVALWERLLPRRDSRGVRRRLTQLTNTTHVKRPPRRRGARRLQ